MEGGGPGFTMAGAALTARGTDCARACCWSEMVRLPPPLSLSLLTPSAIGESCLWMGGMSIKNMAGQNQCQYAPKSIVLDHACSGHSQYGLEPNDVLSASIDQQRRPPAEKKHRRGAGAGANKHRNPLETPDRHRKVTTKSQRGEPRSISCLNPLRSGATLPRIPSIEGPDHIPSTHSVTHKSVSSHL